MVSLNEHGIVSKRTVELSLDDELLRRVEHLSHDLSDIVGKLLGDYVKYGATPPEARSQAERRTVEYLGQVNARYGLLSDDFPSL